jgi:hypothetical protein
MKEKRIIKNASSLNTLIGELEELMIQVMIPACMIQNLI